MADQDALIAGLAFLDSFMKGQRAKKDRVAEERSRRISDYYNELRTQATKQEMDQATKLAPYIERNAIADAANSEAIAETTQYDLDAKKLTAQQIAESFGGLTEDVVKLKQSEAESNAQLAESRARLQQVNMNTKRIQDEIKRDDVKRNEILSITGMTPEQLDAHMAKLQFETAGYEASTKKTDSLAAKEQRQWGNISSFNTAADQMRAGSQDEESAAALRGMGYPANLETAKFVSEQDSKGKEKALDDAWKLQQLIGVDDQSGQLRLKDAPEPLRAKYLETLSVLGAQVDDADALNKAWTDSQEATRIATEEENKPFAKKRAEFKSNLADLYGQRSTAKALGEGQYRQWAKTYTDMVQYGLDNGYSHTAWGVDPSVLSLKLDGAVSDEDYERINQSAKQSFKKDFSQMLNAYGVASVFGSPASKAAGSGIEKLGSLTKNPTAKKNVEAVGKYFKQGSKGQGMTVDNTTVNYPAVVKQPQSAPKSSTIPSGEPIPMGAPKPLALPRPLPGQAPNTPMPYGPYGAPMPTAPNIGIPSRPIGIPRGPMGQAPNTPMPYGPYGAPLPTGPSPQVPSQPWYAPSMGTQAPIPYQQVPNPQQYQTDLDWIQSLLR